MKRDPSLVRCARYDETSLARLPFSLLFAILSVCAAWLFTRPAGAQVTPYYATIWESPNWYSYHGLTSAEYQDRFGWPVLQGCRLVDVSGYGVHGIDYYAGIWEENDGRNWRAHHGLSTADYQSLFDQYAGEGYRPVHVTGYAVNGVTFYAAIWEENNGLLWAAHHGLTASDYLSLFAQYVSQGYRLTDLSGYSVNGVARYAAIWEKRDGPDWVAHHGLTAANYQYRFDLYASLGYRLVRVSGYSINGATYYSAIWEQNDGRVWAAHHGLSAADYKARFDQYAGQGYRLVHVSGYEVNGTPYFAGIWEQSGGITPWITHHGMSEGNYRSLFSQYASQGYRLLDVKGYEVNGADQYAAIWEQRGGPPWITHHGMSEDDYRSRFAQYASQGYRLVHVCGYGVNGVARYAAIWEQNDGRTWVGEHRLTSEAFQNLFDQYDKQGYRLVDLDAYTVNDVPYYAGIWEQTEGPGPDWAVRHVMTEAEYVSLFAQYAGQGFQVVRVSPYVVSGFPMVAAIWEKKEGPWVSEHGLTDAQYQSSFSQHVNQGYRLRSVSGYAVDQSVPNVPASGVPVPSLSPFDDAMKRFIAKRNIPAAVLCVSRGGKILLERAYGYQDRAKTVPLKPNAMFRIASVTKPITKAAIKKLEAQGRLTLADKVFDLGQIGGGILHITPFGSPAPYLNRITVNHLLEHQGGWDRGLSGDPMFKAIEIAIALGVPSPPSQGDTARYMMGRPLDFYPGSETVYSNFGYLLLGLIVEQITGEDYTAYIQREIFNPLGTASTEVELGHSLPPQRNPREPWYSDPHTDPSVFNPFLTVSSPDGGFYLEAMEPHGGLISTARAYSQFLCGYWINGFPRNGETQNWDSFGSLPGTYSLARQRSDGVNIAIFVNQRADDDSYSIIKGVMDSAADSIITWPTIGLE